MVQDLHWVKYVGSESQRGMQDKKGKGGKDKGKSSAGKAIEHELINGVVKAGTLLILEASPLTGTAPKQFEILRRRPALVASILAHSGKAFLPIKPLITVSDVDKKRARSEPKELGVTGWRATCYEFTDRADGRSGSLKVVKRINGNVQQGIEVTAGGGDIPVKGKGYRRTKWDIKAVADPLVQFDVHGGGASLLSRQVADDTGQAARAVERVLAGEWQGRFQYAQDQLAEMGALDAEPDEVGFSAPDDPDMEVAFALVINYGYEGASAVASSYQTFMQEVPLEDRRPELRIVDDDGRQLDGNAAELAENEHVTVYVDLDVRQPGRTTLWLEAGVPDTPEREELQPLTISVNDNGVATVETYE